MTFALESWLLYILGTFISYCRVPYCMGVCISKCGRRAPGPCQMFRDFIADHFGINCFLISFYPKHINTYAHKHFYKFGDPGVFGDGFGMDWDNIGIIWGSFRLMLATLDSLYF